MPLIHRLPEPATIPAALGSRDAATRMRKAVRKAWDALEPATQRLIESDFGASVLTFLAVDKTTGRPGGGEVNQFVRLVRAFQARGKTDLTIHPGYKDVRAADDTE